MKTALLFGAQTLIPFPRHILEASQSKTLYTGEISLYSEHSAERLSVQYLNKKTSRLNHKAWQQLNHLFRCHYDNQVHPIHPMLFLLLDLVRCQLGAKERPYCLVSGYRSPTYNQILCCEDSHVAHRSYHLKGMAADITLEGVATKDIVKMAKRLHLGGVGKYPDFVHLDVGPARTW